MKIIINILLVALIGLLGWLLYVNIQEPIEFDAERNRREGAVIAKLQQIRQAQEHYRDITGEFAASFDTLKEVLTNGEFQIVNVIGDPDDPNFDISDITYDTSYFPAFDSIKALGINLDSLPFIPFSNGKRFDIQADTLTYQKTLVNVVEVGTVRNTYMGPYADARFSKYDQGYDPNSRIKFGDLFTPNTSGNWEQ